MTKKDQRFELRLDPATKAMGNALAKSDHKTLSEWLRGLIWREYTTRYAITPEGRQALEEAHKQANETR